ncbi:MAG: polysaccharide pyruvyl transferase CsaB [Firmicutes bacterium]|nr:polysaccharide pyruvyl transferase CsaB [Bacillota bacterium]
MRVVISGYHGMGNTGDEAVLEAFLQRASEIAPGLECTVLSGDPTATSAAYGVHSVPRTHVLRIVWEILRCDIVISGGGSLLQDVTGPWSVPYYLGMVALACAFRKPVSIYAQGIGPLRSQFYRWLTRTVLSRTSTISVRDPGSLQRLEEMGLRSPKPVLVADPAFGLVPSGHGETPGPSDREDLRRTVLFALRPWPHLEGRESDIARAVDGIASSTDARPVMLAFQPDQDEAFARRVSALSASHPEVVPCTMRPSEVMGMIGGAGMVVGMRLHSLILAAAASVPFVGIDYDPKVAAFFAMVGSSDVVPVDASSDDLIRACEVAWSRREEIRQYLRRVVPGLARAGARAVELALAPVRPSRGSILGLPVDCVSMEEAICRASGLVRSGVGGHVVTLNPEMALAARKDRELREAILNAELVVPDGIGVVMGLRLLGGRPRGRVAGIELATGLMALAAKMGHSFFLVGAKPGVAQRAADNMRAAYPGLSIVGVHHGYFARDEEPNVLDAIESSNPDYVLVALGAGRQERWIAQARKAAPRAVWIGVGGTLDVLAGDVKRAPVAFRRLGLEWLYRLISEPSRARRMAALPRFVAAVIWEVLRLGAGRPSGGDSENRS